MTIRHFALFAAAAWLLAIAACTATGGGETTAAPEASEPSEWAAIMERVGDEKDFIESQFLGSLDRVDLPRVAESARRIAGWIARGYGPLEDPRIPGFADYARAAEAWLLQLAVEAEAGRAEIARDLFDLADEKHCVQCHDAADKVK